MLNLDELIDLTGADSVAGDVIASVDGKAVVLAKRNANGYFLTEEGMMLANTLTPKKSRRKAVDAGDQQAVVATTTGAADTSAIGLNFMDDVQPTSTTSTPE